MPKRGVKKPKPVVGDPNDPDGLAVWMRRFLDHLRVKNFSERTIENRASYITFFITWAADRSVVKPAEVTKPILERYTTSGTSSTCGRRTASRCPSERSTPGSSRSGPGSSG